MDTTVMNRQNFTARLNWGKLTNRVKDYAYEIGEGDLYKEVRLKIKRAPDVCLSVVGNHNNEPYECVRMIIRGQRFDGSKKFTYDYIMRDGITNKFEAIWETLKEIADKKSELHKKIFIG